MYHMIHATDHPEAPSLMSRAYIRRPFFLRSHRSNWNSNLGSLNEEPRGSRP